MDSRRPPKLGKTSLGAASCFPLPIPCPLGWGLDKRGNLTRCSSLVEGTLTIGNSTSIYIARCQLKNGGAPGCSCCLVLLNQQRHWLCYLSSADNCFALCATLFRVLLRFSVLLCGFCLLAWSSFCVVAIPYPLLFFDNARCVARLPTKLPPPSPRSHSIFTGVES